MLQIWLIVCIQGIDYGFEIRMQDTNPYTTRILCAGYYPEEYTHLKLEILYR
jgi:hypothetical protein